MRIEAVLLGRTMTSLNRDLDIDDKQQFRMHRTHFAVVLSGTR